MQKFSQFPEKLKKSSQSYRHYSKFTQYTKAVLRKLSNIYAEECGNKMKWNCRNILSWVGAHTVKITWQLCCYEEKYAAVKMELHYKHMYPAKYEALFGFCGLQSEQIRRFTNKWNRYMVEHVCHLWLCGSG